MILSKPFPGWWEGEVIDGRARGARGLFPENYVQVEEEGRIEEIGDEKEINQVAQTLTGPAMTSPMTDSYNRRLDHARRF